MKTLILGAGGMLGLALGRAFNDREVILWDQTELDITDELAVREKILAVRPDLIINAAAYTDVDGAETNRAAAFAVNEAGVGNVARVVKDMGAVLVHYSTDYVFSGREEKGYREDDPPGPAVNGYGESKLAGERSLKEVGPNFYLIRSAWLYGPGGRNFIDTMVTLGKRGGEIKVVNDQYGSPTYVKDLAEASKKMVDNKLGFGIYHLVNAGVTTWYKLAVNIFKQLKWDLTIVPVLSAEFPRPARRPQWSRLINERGPKLRSWQNALADYLREGMIDK